MARPQKHWVAEPEGQADLYLITLIDDQPRPLTRSLPGPSSPNIKAPFAFRQQVQEQVPVTQKYHNKTV